MPKVESARKKGGDAQGAMKKITRKQVVDELAAIGMANTIFTVISAIFSMVTTGSSILVSRQVGAGENQDAADTIEQSVFLSMVVKLLTGTHQLLFRVTTQKNISHTTTKNSSSRLLTDHTFGQLMYGICLTLLLMLVQRVAKTV